MGAFLRMNLEIRANEDQRIVLPLFTGQVTGNPWDFAGQAPLMTWGASQGAPGGGLVLTGVASANGRVALNAQGNLGLVVLIISAALANAILASGSLMQHLLKVTDRVGRARDLMIGASAIVPGS